MVGFHGAPDWIRTSDLRLRRATLYPTELRARGWTRRKRGGNRSPFGARPVGCAMPDWRGSRTRAQVYFATRIHTCLRSPTVSAEHDRKFFDTFMLILGILAAVTIGLIVLAGIISDRTVEAVPRGGPAQARRPSRASRRSRGSPSPARTTRRWHRPPPPRRPRPSTCRAKRSTSRSARSAMAPPSRARRRRATRPRGRRASRRACDTLNKHALEGFQGKAGYMPPKGGRTDLSDQSVMNAVDYLVGQAK